MYTMRDFCFHVCETEKESPELRAANDRLHNFLELYLGENSQTLELAEKLSADCMVEEHFSGFTQGFYAALGLTLCKD